MRHLLVQCVYFVVPVSLAALAFGAMMEREPDEVLPLLGVVLLVGIIRIVLRWITVRDTPPPS